MEALRLWKRLLAYDDGPLLEAQPPGPLFLHYTERPQRDILEQSVGKYRAPLPKGLRLNGSLKTHQHSPSSLSIRLSLY